ncbi:MAG: hypothetical protein JO316_14840 [Abitibacteriaceae bacterium]|nr:hypothetical protein [Abditibacteriaceae bacterium]MBV9866629.1 hypothetical protein [Abditibacteriaceae bacterium]
MKNHSTKPASATRAERFYSFLLRFYPVAYRQAYAPLMLQTFRDYYNDVQAEQGQVSIGFWLAVGADELKSILREQLASLKEGVMMKDSWKKQGILFGIMLGAAQIVYHLINNLANPNLTLNNILNDSIPVSVLLCCGLAGYFGAKKAGTIQAGTYAGLLTGFISNIIGVSALFLITFMFMDTIRHNTFMIQDFQRSGLKSMDQFIVEDAMGGAAVATCVSLVLGGVLGMIGGLVGKKLSPSK